MCDIEPATDAVVDYSRKQSERGTTIAPVRLLEILARLVLAEDAARKTIESTERIPPVVHAAALRWGYATGYTPGAPDEENS